MRAISVVTNSILALVGVAALFQACEILNAKAGLDNDNFAEELIESQIEKHTGLDIDLTPFSPE